VVRELTEDLLRAMLDHEGSGALHEWLCGLTFIRMTSRGLAPHDEIRRWLMADLRWRAPTTERILVQRACDHLLADIDGSKVEIDQRACDIAYILRGRAPYIDAQGGAWGYGCRRFDPMDWPIAEALTERYEGPTSLSYLRFWRDRAHDAYAIVNPDDRLESFAVLLWFDRISPEDARHDPGVLAVRRWLESIDAADKHCWYTRFWMSERTYQGPSPANTTSFSLSVPEMLAQKPLVMAMCRILQASSRWRL